MSRHRRVPRAGTGVSHSPGHWELLKGPGPRWPHLWPVTAAHWGQWAGGILGRFQAALAQMYPGKEGPCSEAKAEPRASLAFTRGCIKNGLNTIKSVTFMAKKYGKTIKPAEHRMREHCSPWLPTGADEQTDCSTERSLSQFKTQSSISPSPGSAQLAHGSQPAAGCVPACPPSSTGPPLSSDANPTSPLQYPPPTETGLRGWPRPPDTPAGMSARTSGRAGP